ncbi:MAG: Sir2 family NAD-dependent protein deacetylase [Chloroflexi bacterium]|nr:Sir2 family NAD-dependent protein deacetylase [Chloroflexota bacterium]
MGNELEELIEEVAALIVEAKTVVVFTGAGVSTESSLSDFRSPEGIWTKVSMMRMIDQVQPNPAHYAIAELEKLGKLDCAITQNVDGLHQKAGVPEEKVIELHGSLRWMKCLGCGKRYPTAEIANRVEQGVKEPVCDDCGGTLKSATISFGEPMPAEEIKEAERRSRSCDLMIVVGSSLAVFPAAWMPIYAKESGAKLAIINVGPTPVDRHADVRISESAGDAMSKILERVKSKLAA